MRWIERQWQGKTIVSALLMPLAWFYGALMCLRRTAYRRNWRRSVRMPVPVIVVGNITVGGTGKTPLVIWLARRLTTLGSKPGIVTRGYRGNAREWPQQVTPQSDPGAVGDEPVLLAQRAQVPVVADPDRVRGARRLVEQGCDIIISDDGMQHYRMQRDVEIAVIDGVRRFGNARLLPAGPLREPVSRLKDVDARIVNGNAATHEWSLTLEPTAIRPVADAAAAPSLDWLRGRTLHGVAGIGNPSRFFALLRRLGATVIEHPFPDHHRYRAADLAFAPAHDIIMTEKDAVKCRHMASDRVWCLSVEPNVDPRFDAWLQTTLKELRRG